MKITFNQLKQIVCEKYMSDDELHNQYNGWWLSELGKYRDRTRTSYYIDAYIEFPNANKKDEELYYGRQLTYKYDEKDGRIVDMNSGYLPSEVEKELIKVIKYAIDNFGSGQSYAFYKPKEFYDWIKEDKIFSR